jgi:hypothetical protein
MAKTARNMTARLRESMQRRYTAREEEELVEAIRRAAPSTKAANAAIHLVFGPKHGGTRRKRR